MDGKEIFQLCRGRRADIEHYASIDWKESARIVESMRKQFWGEDNYPGKVEMVIVKQSLKI